MTRLAQAKVERGGWYDGQWLTKGERTEAEKRWAGRSYKFRLDDEYQCGGCRFFAATGMDYGICANPASPLDGSITFEHGGCGEHSVLVARRKDTPIVVTEEQAEAWVAANFTRNPDGSMTSRRVPESEEPR